MPLSNPIPLPVRVLEYREGSFKGKDGNDVQYNSALVRFDGIVVKMTTDVNLDSSLDKDIVVAVEIRKGANDVPKLRIVGVVDGSVKAPVGE